MKMVLPDTSCDSEQTSELDQSFGLLTEGTYVCAQY